MKLYKVFVIQIIMNFRDTKQPASKKQNKTKKKHLGYKTISYASVKPE